MKRCRFCAEEIQDAAVVCKHCGRDLVSGQGATVGVAVPPKKATGLGTRVFAVVLALAFIGWCSSAMTRPPTTATTTPTPNPSAAPPPAPAPPPDRLVLLSSNGYQTESGNYWYVEGEVKNISPAPIKSLMAVSTWYGKDDGFIKSDSAMVDFDPLLPGQTAPFKTISRGNPKMSKYSVEFKTIFGGTISARDERKRKK